MTHSQVFGQKFTPIRRFLAWKTHPFWPHIPHLTQCGSAPPPGVSKQFTTPKQKARILGIVVENEVATGTYTGIRRE